MLKRTIIIAAAVASFAGGAQASSIDSLKGIEAETLNAVEMQEIQGQITFDQLIDAVRASRWYSTNRVAGERWIAKLSALYSKYPTFFSRVLAYIKVPV
jgi:hypothetical protein